MDQIDALKAASDKARQATAALRATGPLSTSLTLNALCSIRDKGVADRLFNVFQSIVSDSNGDDVTPLVVRTAANWQAIKSMRNDINRDLRLHVRRPESCETQLNTIDTAIEKALSDTNTDPFELYYVQVLYTTYSDDVFAWAARNPMATAEERTPM